MFWAKGLTEQCQYQNQSCKCIGCLCVAVSFGIFRKMNPREPCVIHVPSPHASPDETYMFCGFPVIFTWNHRPTANNKQPKTSLQTLGWEKWQRDRSCPAMVFFGFASPSKLTQQASKPETVFLVGFARPGGFHFIPKNRARTQDSAEQSLACGFTFENVFFWSSYPVRLKVKFVHGYSYIVPW